MVQRQISIGPSTFYGHIVASSGSGFTVEDDHGVQHKTQAFEMFIEVQPVLSLLSATRRIAQPQPPQQHAPRRRDTPETQQTREAARGIAMVDAFIKREVLGSEKTRTSIERV